MSPTCSRDGRPKPPERMQKMKTALVTGAAGFIGSTLVDRLLADGWGVVGVDSFEDYYPREYKDRNLGTARLSTDFRMIERSIVSMAEREDCVIADAIAEADVVFHLAAQPGVRASWGSGFRHYSDNNVLGTQLVLEACRAAGTPRVVYASSSSVYGDTDQLPMVETARCLPFSPYGVSKLAGESLCYLYHRNYGLNTVGLRFFTVYGPRQRPDMGFHRFIRAVLEGRELCIYGDGNQTRDFTYVADIVEGLIAAASVDAGGEVVNLGGGSRVSVCQVLDIIGEVLAAEVKVRMAERQAGDVGDTWAALGHARDILGYKPRTSLREGIEAEAAWLRGLAEDPGFPWGVSGT